MDISRNKTPDKTEYQPVCPKCQNIMVTFKLGYNCTNKNCTFWIPREIRQKVLTPNTIIELIEKKETGVIHGFHKKGSSQTFAAKLFITENWKIAIRLDGESVLECPRCNGTMYRFDKGYKCNNTLKCDYILWNRFGGKELTTDQMEKLVLEKKTEIIHGFKRKKNGKPYSAKIIMKNEGVLGLEFENKYDDERN